MRLVSNAGNDRVFDLITIHLVSGSQLDCVTPSLSLFAFDELRQVLKVVDGAKLILPSSDHDLHFLGHTGDRSFRNRLNSRWLALQLADWVEANVEVKRALGEVPQSTLVIRNEQLQPEHALFGSFSLSTDGLGITPGNSLSLIQASESGEEAKSLASWFDQQWLSLKDHPDTKQQLVRALRSVGKYRDPYTLYCLMLHNVFMNQDNELDEEHIVKSATGIRDTVVWKKLYKFQRDGVIGAIDKINRFGGCIIADSVGLGKTFEALAIIKYHELRNDRVLVLCPKRLRDNWTIYKANDRRNILAADRFNFDVLNHTDLSRNAGTSGDINLSHVNWGNYDLVVIDESHNLRNKGTHRGRESRYERLMRRIIQEGVKTRVLMLSATPVNNRLADLRNQILFATEGNDTALSASGIASIEATTRKAQFQFNRWLELPSGDKTPTRLIDMLGFDYFTLLDHLTIARSRRHIEKYYGTSETGKFPDRLAPINIKADVDLASEFPSIAEINQEIRRLKLASYAPLRYVFPHKQAAYDAKYSTEIRGGEGFFRQADREESLIHLIRINVLKRMESAVSSFRQTIERQLRDVEAMLARIEAQNEEIEEVDVTEIDLEDPAFEALLIGRKIKVLLGDVDLVRWRQDLTEDRNRLRTLLNAAHQISDVRDAKLDMLRTMIESKCNNPINEGNRKIIVFTAFVDTAEYLYSQLAQWAKENLGIETALVTGGGKNRTTLTSLSKDLSSILTTFSPRSKERPADLADAGEIDLLIATDCISEGQNLQDCDWLINYDIHWNPVRIVQRCGRIDRSGSPNKQIQLVNFWPNMELEEYINLEQRVSGRMVLLDVSASGEENLIEQQSGNPMNDLEYRRKQLFKLQETVIDLEDFSSGVSITDLTLTDFRIDLAQYSKLNPGVLESQPIGVSAVTTSLDVDIDPGIVFCLRGETSAASKVSEPNYPLAPYYLLHVGDDGSVLLPYSQAKRVLDRLKRLSMGKDLSDSSAEQRYDQITKGGSNPVFAQKLLSGAVSSIIGKSEERSVASLFSPGGTHVIRGEFAGINDFEVIAYMVVLPEVSL